MRYKVFIASPSGLEDERKAFRDTIYDYNEFIDEQGRRAVFKPVGWEDTLGGAGRPQSVINEDIAACDYFILLLWDRWGSSVPGPIAQPAKRNWLSLWNALPIRISRCARSSSFSKRSILDR
ncbi:DUF4062 domain-containing protein [Candidatus Entotheonella palauensis]|uniref:DUF4062 domain-containing protein n=1 Tax=Candidatus Entotheonella palauensis TaxID=93172 RepID=UPI0034DE3BAC